MLEFFSMSDVKDKSNTNSSDISSYMWRGGGRKGNLKRVVSAMFGGAAAAAEACAEVGRKAQEQVNEQQRRNIMQGREPWDLDGTTETHAGNPFRQNFSPTRREH